MLFGPVGASVIRDYFRRVIALFCDVKTIHCESGDHEGALPVPDVTMRIAAVWVHDESPLC